MKELKGTNVDMHSPQKLKTSLQSVPQDQKSVIFLHSVFTLNQLLQHLKYAAEVYLTWRNYVKICLSHNISDNFLIVVYHKNLSIKTDWC